MPEISEKPEKRERKSLKLPNPLGRLPEGQRTTTAVGAIFMVLALVGLATVLSFGWHSLGDMINNTAEKERLEKFLTPVVMFDPIPYDSVGEANTNTMLLTCIWAALLDETAQTYAQDDMGMVVLPAVDVEYQAYRLYGTADLITHQTVDDYEIIYQYDAAVNSYRIPVVAKIAYAPQVDKIQKSGQNVTVRVGYVPPGNSWLAGLSDQSRLDPDKYMIYEMVKVRSGYNITAIKDEENVPNYS